MKASRAAFDAEAKFIVHSGNIYGSNPVLQVRWGYFICLSTLFINYWRKIMKNSRHAMFVALFCLPLTSVAFADKAIDMKAEAASIAAVEGASINILSPTDSVHLDAGGIPAGL